MIVPNDPKDQHIADQMNAMIKHLYFENLENCRKFDEEFQELYNELYLDLLYKDL